MNRRPLYVAAIAVPLAASFVLGNPDVSETARSVSPFPSLLSVLAVPVALGLALRDFARSGRSVAVVESEGRAVSFWAAAVFALCVGTFGLGLYWHEGHGYDYSLPAFGAAVAFAWTYLLGRLSASGWARVLGKPVALAS